MESKRIYIVRSKNCEFVNQRLTYDVAVPECHYETPSAAWSVRVRDFPQIEASDHIIVGADTIPGKINEFGAQAVTVDWNDVHEATGVPWSPEC